MIGYLTASLLWSVFWFVLGVILGYLIATWRRQ